MTPQANINMTRTNLDKNELKRLHIERGMSGKQVAEHLGIHPSTAIKYLRKYDLYTKENSYGKESQQNLPQVEA